MEETALQIVSHYGYWAIALLLAGGIIGLPLPDELLLLFCGYLVFLDELHLFSTIIWCFCGSIIGMTVSYVLGAKVGSPFLVRYGKRFGIKEEYLSIAQRWFQRFGPFSILIGYYIPGFRQLTAFCSAASHIPYWKFILFAIPGGLIWVFIFVEIGCYLGLGWHSFSVGYHYYLYIFIFLFIIALAAIISYIGIKHFYKTTAAHHPKNK